MDPVSAIGLVASITGIVSFGSKTVKIASQIRQAGSHDGILSLESSADDMNKAAQLLRRQSSSQSGSSAGSDQGMLLLADRSLKVVDSIVKLSEDVRGAQRDGKSAGRWSAMQQAFKVILNGDRIDSLEKELNGIRGGLQLQGTVLIKEKLETNSMKLDDALKSLGEYSASLLSAGSVLDELRVHANTIIKNQSRGEILAEARHAEVMQYIATPRHPDSDPQSRALQSRVKSGEEALRTEQIAAQRILDWLWFPDMAEREETIDSAFDQTLEWVFCDSKRHQKPWDNFGSFLRSNDSKTYWITGKPGSGKSTLMKFIANNSKTTDYLNDWSGAEPVLTAKYYFSHRASELQKTEAGMLRSLHYQILQQKRAWIEQAHPGRFRIHRDLENGLNGTTTAASAPSNYELRTGLDYLINAQPSSRFFFIIDGLDEHKATEETVGLLANSLLRLATHPNVKILISSRPWPVFEDALDKSPRLQVHEMTRDDILHFTTTKILKHPRTLMLQGQDPTMINTLINEIADASSGVFLWVSLVVRSLLQGLKNHDTAEDLRTRLHELPTELHDFFYHMWTQVPERYKAQASRLLQLIEAGTTDGNKISLLGLNFAQEADEYARKMKVEPLPDEEVGARIETTRTHLLTRSVGLVEVLNIQKPDTTLFQSMRGDLYYTSSAEASQGYPHAAFIHKTVYEFLSVPDIRQELERVTTSGLTDNTAPFSPVACLLRSALVKIKTFQPVAKSSRGGGSTLGALPHGLEALVDLFLGLARETEQTTGLGQTWLLEELDHTMSLHQRASTRPRVSWLSGLAYKRKLAQGILIKDHEPIKDLVGLAVVENLFYTLKDMVADNPLTWPGLSSRKRPLLLDALFPMYPDLQGQSPDVKKRQPRFEMVDLLLQTSPEPKDSVKVIIRGARPKEAYEMCLWNIYADKVFANPRSDLKPRAVETFLRIFKLFLKYHTDYKSTTADLASMRSRFVAFLKSPQTQADARLSRFNHEMRDAVVMIKELELSWARQRKADSESTVKWREEGDILGATSEEETDPEEYTNPGTDLVQENNEEGYCIDSGAKHRTPNGSSRTDRIRRWFHQR